MPELGSKPANNSSPSTKENIKFNALEDEAIKGLNIQQNWLEKPELTILSSNLLRFTRISPNDKDDDWETSTRELESSLTSMKFKVLKKLTALKSRQADFLSIENEKKAVRSQIRKKEDEIENAKQNLIKAKRNRKNREEYERMAKDISKRPSLGEIEKVLKQEIEQKTKAEEQAAIFHDKFKHTREQASVVLDVTKKFINSIK